MRTFNALAVARKTSELTQRQLAVTCNVSQQAISNYERGTRRPPPAVAQKLARLLREPIERLFPSESYDGMLLTPIRISRKGVNRC